MTSSRKAASKIRRTFFAILNSELCETDLHPFTLRKIYQSVVLPRALYGCEFWHDLSESQRPHLERSHRLCVQGIDQCTRSCVALNLLGIPNLESEIMKKKCTLFGQICRLDPYCTVKRIFLHRLTSHYFFNDVKYGFIVDTLRIIIITDLGLERCIVNFLNTRVFPSKYFWKKKTSAF